MAAIGSRRVLIGAIALAMSIAAGLALFGFVRSRGVEANAAAGTKVASLEFLPDDLFSVKREPLARGIPLTGTLVALNAATVKAKVAGELVEVAVREGEAVRKGQVLARIDQTEVEARAAARAADAAAARAQLQLAEKNRATQKALLEKNFISQNAFDATQSAYEVAAARLRAAEADLVAARKTLGDSTLLAPISGSVSERHAQPGERVPLDAKVISVVDLSILTLEASLPASSIAQVKVGQAVEFKVDGFVDRRFLGRIDRINPATSPGSRSISVYATVENGDRALRGGLFAQGQVLLEQTEQAMVVPSSSIREEIGQTFVYALDNGVLRKKAVKIGASGTNGLLQVQGALKPGDVIVKSNLGQLKEGVQVQVRDQTVRPRPSNPAK